MEWVKAFFFKYVYMVSTFAWMKNKTAIGKDYAPLTGKYHSLIKRYIISKEIYILNIYSMQAIHLIIF